MVTIKHDSSGKERPFKNSGKKGESLFPNFITKAAARELELINKNYTRHLSYMSRAKDDRLLAIVGALAVEEALDSLLIAYIPDYKVLHREDHDITFSMKMNLMRSLKLIPSHLLDTVDIIGKIRNEFAHELDKDDFNSVSVKKKDKFIKIFKELHPKDDVNNYSMSYMFDTTIRGILVCFGAYASNLKIAKEYIYSDGFFQKIGEIVKGNSK